MPTPAVPTVRTVVLQFSRDTVVGGQAFKANDPVPEGLFDDRRLRILVDSRHLREDVISRPVEQQPPSAEPDSVLPADSNTTPESEAIDPMAGASESIIITGDQLFAD